MNWLERTSILLGEQKIKELASKNVIVVGLGGVGSYAAELIARSGVGYMTIIDGDIVNESNRNRQLPALCSTNGQLKAEVVANRLKDINPHINLHVVTNFIDEDSFGELLSKKYDYVVDAIDTLSPKVALISESIKSGSPIISSMGAGGRFDPSKVQLSDISNTTFCVPCEPNHNTLY